MTEKKEPKKEETEEEIKAEAIQTVEKTNFDECVIHPTLDFKKDNLILGFRKRVEINKFNNIYLIKIKDLDPFITAIHNYKIEEKTYYMDIKGKTLPLLEQQWSEKEMKNLVKNFTTDKSNRTTIFPIIKGIIKEYINLDCEEDYTLMTAWSLGTYFTPMFSAYPYLHIKAPKGSGKSQCLKLLSQVCFNAVKARATLPAMRDTIDSLRGTFLMDQAESLFRVGNEEMQDILTDSYKNGGGKTRKQVRVKGGAWKTEEFETYGPKAFATINELPFDLRDRCIIVPLVRAIGRNFKEPDDEYQDWKDVRGQMYKLLINEFDLIKGRYEMEKINSRKTPTLTGRTLELWLPLYTIMLSLSVPDEEIEKTKKVFLSRYNFAESRILEIEEKVFQALFRLLEESNLRALSPSDIAEKVDFSSIGVFLEESKKAIRVGRIISKFNLASEKNRGSGGVMHTFEKDRVKRIYQSYSPLEIENEHTQPTQTEKNVPRIEDF